MRMAHTLYRGRYRKMQKNAEKFRHSGTEEKKLLVVGNGNTETPAIRTNTK